jgi:hypothetical protein
VLAGGNQEYLAGTDPTNAASMPGMNFYVAPNGNDGNAGTTPAAAFATIQHAHDVVRAQIAGGLTENITVHLGAGNYFVDGAPVVFDDRDGGNNGYTVTYLGATNLGTRIYGGRQITNWTQVATGEYTATVTDLVSHCTLYENDEAANGGFYHTFAGVTAGNWSRSGTTLTYYPRNLPITNQVVVLGTTPDVFYIKGRSTQQIVSNLVFDGLYMIGSDFTNSWPNVDFHFAAWTGVWDGRKYNNQILGVIWPELRHGQFYLRNAQNVVVRNSKLYGSGFGTVFFDRWAQSNVVANCWIERAQNYGLYLQGWEPGRGMTDGITTLAASYCNKFNVVTNNVFRDNAGITMEFSGDNRIEHNVFNGCSIWEGGWRPQMINNIGYYSYYGGPASGIPYPYAQTNVTFYSDNYIVTEANQGAGLDHTRNNLIRYNDISQAPRSWGDSGMLSQWGAGTNNVWAYNALHDIVALGGWCFFPFYNDDGSHQTTIKGNIVYWVDATAANTAGLVSKGNFQMNTGNIFADSVLGQGGANIGPFCEEATRATWATNIVAAEVGRPYTGGGTQTPVQAVHSAYQIDGTDDTDANIASIIGSNAFVAYPVIQSAGNNVYYYQRLDRADSPGSGPANLQNVVNGNRSVDKNSVYADPLFNRQHPWWDARYTDYALQTNSPALARGFQQIDLNQIGLQAGFPFNVTNILGQTVSKIRLAADYSRLLKVSVNGQQLIPGSGALPWARYNWMDFGAGQYDQFLVHLQYVSSPQNQGTAIEIRLDAPDGTLIGTVPYGQTTCRITPTSGLHDIFLVFPSGNVQTVDWFIFKPRVIWTGNGTDNKWSTAANWTGTVTNGVPLYFGASNRTTLTNDLSAGQSFAGLSFDAGAPSFTLAGNSISLTGDIINSSTNNQTINLPITLPGLGTTRVDTGASAVTLGGGLSQSSGSSSSFTKAGTGTLTLTGTFNYTGNVTIEGGTLVFTQVGLADTANVWIGTTNNASAMLDLEHGLADRVTKLYIDGVLMPDGTYGSSASAATYKDDTAFRGPGMIVVQSGPCPPMYSTRADGYTVATFSGAGTGTWVVPAGVTNVQVLVVGGGGGTGSQSSGAGAGGMYYSSSYPVTAGSSLNVAVGAGGTAGANSGGYDYSAGGTGGTSQFGQVLAYGGLPGGSYDAGGNQGGYSTDGGATTNAGNLGGYSPTMTGNYGSGGGAGAPGVDHNNSSGGAGLPSSITGTELYYAGGGGAGGGGVGSGAGGSDVGGHGADGTRTQLEMSGMDGRGGGAGGGWGGNSWTGGGNGGSGVVIVAYQASAPVEITASIQKNGADMDVTFTFGPTVTTKQYRLVYKVNVTDTSWTPIGSWTTGTAPTTTLTDAAPSDTQRFYQVEVQ